MKFFTDLLINSVRLLGAFSPQLFFFRKIFLPFLLRKVFPESLRVLLETFSGLFIQRILADIAGGELGTGRLEFVVFKFDRHVNLPDLYLIASRTDHPHASSGGQSEFSLREDNHYWSYIKGRECVTCHNH